MTGTKEQLVENFELGMELQRAYAGITELRELRAEIQDSIRELRQS